MKSEILNNEQIYKDLEQRFIYAIRDLENNEFNVTPNDGKSFRMRELRFLDRFCELHNLTYSVYYDRFTKLVTASIY